MGMSNSRINDSSQLQVSGTQDPARGKRKGTQRLKKLGAHHDASMGFIMPLNSQFLLSTVRSQSSLQSKVFTKSIFKTGLPQTIQGD